MWSRRHASKHLGLIKSENGSRACESSISKVIFLCSRGNFKLIVALNQKYGNKRRYEHDRTCQASAVSSKYRLYEAISRSDVATVNALLHLGRSPNQPYQYCACEDYHCGPGLKELVHFWEYPIHKAVVVGKREIVKLLLEYGADANVLDKDNCTPLLKVRDFSHGSFRSGNTAVIMKMLAAHGADMNVRMPERLSDNKDTLLHVFCDEGDWRLAKALLEAGADPTLLNEDGETVLQKAAGCLDHYDDTVSDSDDEMTGYNRGFDVLGIMLQAVYTPEQKKRALGSFIRDEPNVRAVYHVVQVGVPVDFVLPEMYGESRTPMEWCIQKADEIFKEITGGGTRVTPSMCRSLVSWFSVMKLLLNAGAASPTEQEGLKNTMEAWDVLDIIRNCKYEPRDRRRSAVEDDTDVCQDMLTQIAARDSKKGTLQELCAVEIRKSMSPPQRDIWEHRLDMDEYKSHWDDLELPKGVKEYVFGGDLATVLATYRQYEMKRGTEYDDFELCSSPESDRSYKWYAWWDHFWWHSLKLDK